MDTKREVDKNIVHDVFFFCLEWPRNWKREGDEEGKKATTPQSLGHKAQEDTPFFTLHLEKKAGVKNAKNTNFFEETLQ